MLRKLRSTKRTDAMSWVGHDSSVYTNIIASRASARASPLFKASRLFPNSPKILKTMIRGISGAVISCYLWSPYNPSANKPYHIPPLRGLSSHRVITQSYINSRGTSRILHQTPLNQFSPLCYLQRRFRFELCFLFIYFFSWKRRCSTKYLDFEL